MPLSARTALSTLHEQFLHYWNIINHLGDQGIIASDFGMGMPKPGIDPFTLEEGFDPATLFIEAQHDAIDAHDYVRYEPPSGNENLRDKYASKLNGQIEEGGTEPLPIVIGRVLFFEMA